MSRKPWRTVLGAATLVCLISFSPANAEDSAAPNINQSSCIKCHKRNGMMQGIHSRDNLQMQCSSCHGEKGAHPRKPNNLIVFSSTITRVPKQANQPCWRCHKPQALGEQAWFHNVHANKLYCWSCHTLHSQQDPALQPPASQRCRACHASKEVDRG